jgi:hypothetical protein
VTWTFGPGGVFTAVWAAGVVTVTVTSGGALVGTFGGVGLATVASAQALIPGLVAQAIGSGSGVTSWDTRTGAVVPASGDYTYSQVGADQAGAAAAAQAAAQAASVPATDLPLALINGGTGGTSASTARTALGLGTAATANASAFDTAGAAAAVLAEVGAASGIAPLNASSQVPAANVPPAGLSGQYLRTPTIVTSGGPFTTTSATFAALAAGAVSTGSFTAPASGDVMVTVQLQLKATAVANYAFALAATTTVTPIVGNAQQGAVANASQIQPVTLRFPVTGLTAGQSYNFDVLFAVTGATTLTVTTGAGTSTSITAGNAGPIVVEVQQV